MSDEAQNTKQIPRRFWLLRVPLSGCSRSTLLPDHAGGLAGRRPAGAQSGGPARSDPRRLIAGTALGLLLFGFVVTFGSTAMGTAIMASGCVRRMTSTPRAAAATGGAVAESGVPRAAGRF